MPFLGAVLKKTLELRKTLKPGKLRNGSALQLATLLKLIEKAAPTRFGEKYGFEKMLREDNPVLRFREAVPIHDYNSMFSGWWHRTLAGEADVCWPGKVKYFALSSGTSEASSKHLPVTREMLRAIRKTSMRQIFSLAHYDLPEELFEKGILMLGGSTHLNRIGHYFEGDLSGITAGKIPFWFQHFYKPGRRIARERDWETKLDDIANSAAGWDIGIVVGVPAWIQIMMEKVIERHRLKTIHDLWPSLSIYVHGGVAFHPYRKGFEKLLAKPLTYIETYLASEGFIAYQSRPQGNGPGGYEQAGMELVLDNGIFFEFIPFNERNFTPEGTLTSNPGTLLLHEVEENKEYAILLSTCAGAWRYLIGDTIRFTSLARREIVITGRTRHFLSLCGEHLSVDNMNKAVRMLEDELNIPVREFTVSGIPHGSLFAHKWYIGTDTPASPALLKEKIDKYLCLLNDDYRVERSAALKEVFVEVVPPSVFYAWMDRLGKSGGQNKFPRVMGRKQFAEWENFVHESRGGK